MESNLCSLPNETLDSVFFYLQRADLVALATTSHTLAAIARRRLYRSVSLSTATKSGLFTLIHRAELGQSVREFAFDGSAEEDVIHALGSALASVVNVTSVQLTLRPVAETAVKLPVSHLVFAQDGQCQALRFSDAPTGLYTQLKSFACNFTLDSDVVNFLSRCPALISMQLGETVYAEEVAQVPRAIVPRLEQLVAPPSAARLLVPGRPIRALDISSRSDGSGLDEATLDAVARSTEQLLVLDATTPDFRLEQLTSVKRAVGDHLCSLRISVLNALERAPDAAFLAPVADVLDTFPELWNFELSGFHWASRLKDEDSGARRAWQREPIAQPMVDHPTSSETDGDIVDEQWNWDVLS